MLNKIFKGLLGQDAIITVLKIYIVWLQFIATAYRRPEILVFCILFGSEMTTELTSFSSESKEVIPPRLIIVALLRNDRLSIGSFF